MYRFYYIDMTLTARARARSQSDASGAFVVVTVALRAHWANFKLKPRVARAPHIGGDNNVFNFQFINVQQPTPDIFGGDQLLQVAPAWAGQRLAWRKCTQYICTRTRNVYCMRSYGCMMSATHGQCCQRSLRSMPPLNYPETKLTKCIFDLL